MFVFSYILTHCGFKVGAQTIEKWKGCGRLQSAIRTIPVVFKIKVFCSDLCCSERVMVSKCKFQVRSELTQVQESYKASKYCDKSFNTHPHASVGPRVHAKK